MPTWQKGGDRSSPMIAQNEGDEWFSLGAHNLMNGRLYLSNQILAFCQKRMTNSPISWSFIRFIFYAIMMASYSGKLLYHRIYSEFSLWIFYWIYFILPAAKLLTYIGINTMCYIMFMLSSLHK